MFLKNRSHWKGIQAVVLGLGKSGLASSILLSRLGVRVSVSESGHRERFASQVAQLEQWGVSFEFGGHTREFIHGKDLLVVSPGVPINAAPVVWAREEGLPVISELELAGMICRAPIIAVTGTNGKTTTVSLITMLLNYAGIDAVSCGNIGLPLSDIALDMNPDSIAVVEVSSFQLEFVQQFHPWISVILNISDNHLDRHHDLETYLAMKARIFRNQGLEDWTVLNGAQDMVRECVRDTNAQVRFFTESTDFNEDFEAAMTVGSIVGLDRFDMEQTIRCFKGIEHRLEEVGIFNGVRFVNDSKATTPQAMRWALSRVPAPIIMIAGGRNKGTDFAALRAAPLKKVKQMILIGEAQEEIRAALGDLVMCVPAASLEHAVELAGKVSQKGDTVLLSPGCASFDMFANFEERGRVFKDIVKHLNVHGTASISNLF